MGQQGEGLASVSTGHLPVAGRDRSRLVGGNRGSEARADSNTE